MANPGVQGHSFTNRGNCFGVGPDQISVVKGVSRGRGFGQQGGKCLQRRGSKVGKYCPGVIGEIRREGGIAT